MESDTFLIHQCSTGNQSLLKEGPFGSCIVISLSTASTMKCLVFAMMLWGALSMTLTKTSSGGVPQDAQETKDNVNAVVQLMRDLAKAITKDGHEEQEEYDRLLF